MQKPTAGFHAFTHQPKETFLAQNVAFIECSHEGSWIKPAYFKVVRHCYKSMLYFYW